MSFSSNNMNMPGLTANAAGNAKVNRTIPAFLNKLFEMVNDPATDHHIHWNADGTAFIVKNQSDFSAEVLPHFFKHGNFNSFIRQLNMYGFHKVQNIHQGSILSSPDELEFANENFQLNRPDLLCFVVRRRNVSSEHLVKDGIFDVNGVINEISAIKKHQLTISADLQSLQRDNQHIWEENLKLQQKYDNQQNTMDKIVGFLASVFSAKKKSMPTTEHSHSHKRKKYLLGDSFATDEDAMEAIDNPSGIF